MLFPPLVKGVGEEGLSFPLCCFCSVWMLCELDAWGGGSHFVTRRGDLDHMMRMTE